MQKSPPPFVWAAPEENNILTWNFIIRGPPDSPYHGGEYHGQIMFPAEYPFKPPGIKMLTPSGRFAPDKKICFSMSDFHPGTWNPAWSVATICTGILSFMLSDEITTGSITTSDQDKRILAARSHGWNIQQKKFQEAFPEYSGPTMKELPNMGEADRGKPSEESEPATPASFSTAAPTPPSTAGASSAFLLPAARGLPAVPVQPPFTAAASPRGPTARATQEVAAIPPAHRGPNAANPDRIESWTASLGNKWGVAALIVFAVLLSRAST